jgi:hypothetical protein
MSDVGNKKYVQILEPKSCKAVTSENKRKFQKTDTTEEFSVTLTTFYQFQRTENLWVARIVKFHVLYAVRMLTAV